MSAHRFRAARDADGTALIGLIGKVFVEYPGCVLDVDGEMPELKAPATSARAGHGRWWVVEDDEGVVASVAAFPLAEDDAVELKKLYVDAAHRGRGLGTRLIALVEHEARKRIAGRVVLWTDTRFETAHRLYERLGYARAPATRALGDKSGTIEFHFAKPLGKAARPARSEEVGRWP